MDIAIWWVRRDCRLTDNQALSAALAAADQVIPVFIQDPFFARSHCVGAKRKAFYYSGLQQLHATLERRGSRLIIRAGEPLAALSQLLKETGARQIFAEADYSAYARRRDETIQQRLPLQLMDGVMIHHPESLLKQDGTPYRVFTPFKKRVWLARPLPHPAHILPAPEKITTPAGISSLPLPAVPEQVNMLHFSAGEAEAQNRLARFTSATTAPNPIALYQQRRNLLAEDGTSGLSPYLRFGMISARQCAVAALEAGAQANTLESKKGAETWLSELVWREFYQTILYHFPHVARGSFRPEYDRIEWRNDKIEFAAWCQGKTGYPVIDAAMRQLVESGWMHNRARMITASFLVKDLLIDWRWGERFFMEHLIDGDPASNNGGWQWTAGTGTDAAPYFRIFNPITQSKKFDPGGNYLRRWLPEIAAIPDKYIHEPWQLPPLEQKRLHLMIGRDYPEPLLNHKEVRERALAAYKKARQQ